MFKKKEKFAKVEQPAEEEVEEAPVPVAKPFQKQVQKVEEKKYATIVSSELFDSENGLKWKSVIISNASLGEVGETFDL